MNAWNEDSIMKPIEHFEQEEGGNIKGVNLFKTHIIHLWNYHNETLILSMYANLKVKLSEV
jgi:hypothetical protein